MLEPDRGREPHISRWVSNILVTVDQHIVLGLFKIYRELTLGFVSSEIRSGRSVLA